MIPRERCSTRGQGKKWKGGCRGVNFDVFDLLCVFSKRLRTDRIRTKCHNFTGALRRTEEKKGSSLGANCRYQIVRLDQRSDMRRSTVRGARSANCKIMHYPAQKPLAVEEFRSRPNSPCQSLIYSISPRNSSWSLSLRGRYFTSIPFLATKLIALHIKRREETSNIPFVLRLEVKFCASE